VVVSSSSVEVGSASVEVSSSFSVVEISGFEVVVDLEVGFTVTVFCTVSVTLDTAIVVVGFALVDDGDGPRLPDGSISSGTYPYTPGPPQNSSGHAGQVWSHLEISSCDDLEGA
jgi:hypothetical protein